MKGPGELPGSDIVSAYMTGGGGARPFRDARAQDKPVLKDDTRGVGQDEQLFWILPQTFPNVDAAADAELRNGLAAFCIHSVKVKTGREQDPPIVFGRPV